MPPYGRVPPCTLMPFMIEPMACSRMPKCSVRPYGLPGNIFDCRSVGQEARLALHGGVVGLGQVGRATPQLGQLGGQRAQHLAGGGAGGDALGVGVPDWAARPPSPGVSSSFDHPVVERLALGVGRAPSASKALLPLVLGLPPAVEQLAGVGDDLVGHLEGLLRVEAEHLLGGGHLLVAQRGSRAALPVFCLLGAGQPMIVRRLMKLGRSVTSRRLLERRLQRRRRSPRTGCRRWSSRRSARASRTPRSARRCPR